ncbi:TetR family transcriptional regulator [Brevundimonas sp.]|uniref:TetR/AcrR family transcriptional regulator n=1 Tax=Brevundimonas sp. TaxID=1871086 RepID=UPI001A2B9C7B|nr:TetR family transcriptional regulator [Brevundimonas sp.]MBJ7483337.1 helix-turn-helix transcriptional regulator [Brevundimonas sp.]
MKADVARDAIKRAAQSLFAARGVDAVSVRDILTAAGQKNGASLHYYFGSKDDLVVQLVIDGARLIDERRNARLDALEAAGGPHFLRELMEVLILPSTDLGRAGGEGDYLRFISTFSLQNRVAFEAIIGDGWNRGYQRCLDHIRRLAPASPEVLERRLVFLSLGLRAVMTAREAALAANPAHPFWHPDETLDDLVATLVGMVSPSE